jgi:hypothetical protein
MGTMAKPARRVEAGMYEAYMHDCPLRVLGSIGREASITS